jgi:hypothetical protein
MADVYRTKDLSQAAYLMTKGYEVQVVGLGDHCVFEFPADAEPSATEYLRGARVPARIYAQMIRHLKGMVVNTRHPSAA